MGAVGLKAGAGHARASSLQPVAKDLFLHIGIQKTGSTSIQSAAALNRERLGRAGLLYPRIPGDKNHIKLTLFAWDGGKTNHLPIAAGLAKAEDYKRFKAAFVNALRAEAAVSGCKAVFLSNEHLSSRLQRPEQLGRLASALRRIARRITVVVYLRPQHELMLSSYSTSVKGGVTRDMKFPKNDQNFYFNYDWMLSLWADAFGEENIIVRVFDREELVGGDVVSDFFATIGHPPTADFELPAMRNPSLDARALQFLRAFNAHIPAFDGDKNNPERNDIIPALEAASTGPAFTLPKQRLQVIAKMFEPSNANVARRYLGRSDGVLFRNLNVDRGSDSPALTVEDAVALAAHLWQWKQRQLMDARKRLASRKETPLPLDEYDDPEC